jgi:hypothetical protein
VEQQNFVAVCGLAFLTVFILLIVLALAMRVVTLLFAERHTNVDAALIAAISSSVSAISPGARVVQIEEIPCSPPSRPRRFG